MPLLSRAQQDITVMSEDTVSDIKLPPVGCRYMWTNSNPAIGLPANGFDRVGPFVATNTGLAPIKATITATTVTENNHIFFYREGITEPMVAYDINRKVKLGQMPVVDNTGRFWISPDGNYYYIEIVNNRQIAVVNTAYELIRTIDLPYRSSYTYLDPNGDKLYISQTLSTAPFRGMLTVLDIASGAVLYNIDLPAGVLGITPNKDRSKLYIGTSLRSVLVLDLASRTVIAQKANSGTGEVLLTPDETKLIARTTPVSGQSKGIDILDANTLTTLNTIRVTTAIQGMVLSRDGKRLYATGSIEDGINESRLYVIDVPSQKIIEETIVPFGSVGLYLTSDDKILYYLRFGNDNFPNRLYAMDTETFKATDSLEVPKKFSSYWLRVSETRCTTKPFSFTITVKQKPPEMRGAGSVGAKSTVYGEPSEPSQITVGGKYMASGILVTPPNGFEASIDGIAYSKTITVGGIGTIPTTTVYIRLSSTAPVGPPLTGSVVLSSDVSPSINIPVAAGNVTPAPLTLKANHVFKKYGIELRNGPGFTEFTALGIKNNETIGSVTAAFTNGNQATAIKGDYPGVIKISAPVGGTFAITNYSIQGYQDGDITVEPTTLTITAENKMRYYGDADPPFTFKYTGFVNGEGTGQLTRLPTATTDALTLSLPGRYTITPDGASADNYVMQYVPGVLTINGKPLGIANAFTPNGDGINDTWDLVNIYQYPKCRVDIYNRNGGSVFTSLGYTAPWTGKNNGADLPTGIYYYVINLGTDAKPLTGYLTIVR